MRVLAVADSDSYLKWGAATLAAMPAEWSGELVVIDSPIVPSPAQIQAAAAQTVQTVSLPTLILKVLRTKPDVLLLACTGPVVQSILSWPTLRRGQSRPVLVTGLPGISIPASSRAVEFRSGVDLFIVHSRRERTAFELVGAQLGVDMAFGLATLPFVHRASDLATESGPDNERVIFAAQAKIPIERSDRSAVLLALAELPAHLQAVVKVRAVAGEQQTHREEWPYQLLWDELVSEIGLDPADVEFTGGSMAAALQHASGFVTVSSTAALEAFGAQLPVLILSDFGISAEMINLVFEGSGCLGTLDDLRAGRFHSPDPDWLHDNYFQPEVENDWVSMLADLLQQRDSGQLPARQPASVSWRMSLRWQVRLLLPAPVRTARRRILRRLRPRSLSNAALGQHVPEH